MGATLKTVTALLAGLGVLALALSGFMDRASAQGPLVFGIQPARSRAVTAGGASYFEYTLAPGDSIDDSLVVSNGSGDELILKLYAADGITSINGSTAFAGPDDVRSNTRSWLRASVSDILVPASQSVTVAFHVDVPADASPGDHVAGWVVEAPPRAGAAAGIGTTLVERAGVAVVVHVPGDTTQQLVVGGICLNQETGSNYFEIPVRNDGNVLTWAKGSFTLLRKGGDEVFSRPAELGNVVPADGTLLRLDAPFDPGPGDYVAEVRLAQPDGRTVEARAEIKIGEKKANGCNPAAAGVKQEPGQGLPYLGRLPGGGTPWLLMGLLLALMAALMVGREYVIRRRMKSRGG